MEKWQTNGILSSVLNTGKENNIWNNENSVRKRWTYRALFCIRFSNKRCKSFCLAVCSAHDAIHCLARRFMDMRCEYNAHCRFHHKAANKNSFTYGHGRCTVSRSIWLWHRWHIVWLKSTLLAHHVMEKRRGLQRDYIEHEFSRTYFPRSPGTIYVDIAGICFVIKIKFQFLCKCNGLLMKGTASEISFITHLGRVGVFARGIREFPTTASPNYDQLRVHESPTGKIWYFPFPFINFIWHAIERPPIFSPVSMRTSQGPLHWGILLGIHNTQSDHN